MPKISTMLKSILFTAAGVVVALVAVKVLGVDNDVPFFKDAAKALDN